MAFKRRIIIDKNTQERRNIWLKNSIRKEIVLDQKDEDCFDEDSINEIFRTMHTIKGSSGIMMFDNITAVSHKLEDIFYYLRESQPDNVPHLELVEHVLEVEDFISGELEKIRNGKTSM